MNINQHSCSRAGIHHSISTCVPWPVTKPRTRTSVDRNQNRICDFPSLLSPSRPLTTTFNCRGRSTRVGGTSAKKGRNAYSIVIP